MKTLIVTLAGGLTCALTAVLLIVAQKATGFSVYNFGFCYVFPVGAILSGMLGATGYYVGAWLVGCRPTGFLALNMVLVSAATFFLVHFLSYQLLDFNGRPVREQIGFVDYLDATVRNIRITEVQGVKALAPGEPLGTWGYPYAALKVLGFAAGGLVVFTFLRDRPYCRPCGRFLSTVGRHVRYYPKLDDALAAALPVTAAFDAADPARLQPALDSHAASGAAEDDHYFRSTFDVTKCGGCGTGRARFWLERYDQNWIEVAEVSRSADTAPGHDLTLRDDSATSEHCEPS